MDHTLTQGDTLYFPFFAALKPFPGAAHCMRQWAQNGHRILYLSGKLWLAWPLQKLWLWYHGFPLGPSWTIGYWPNVTKAIIVGDFQRRGWKFETGYSEDEVSEEAYVAQGVPWRPVPYPYDGKFWLNEARRVAQEGKTNG
jgi:hypothetical protein